MHHSTNLIEMTNKIQLCRTIYYSIVLEYESLNNNNLQIEQVQQYKYLGSIVNVSNSIEEEIKERIALGTKAYYANLKFSKSGLFTKQDRKSVV